MGGRAKMPKGKAVGSQVNCQELFYSNLKRERRMAVSVPEFWSVFALQCLPQEAMRSYLSFFLEGSRILEKLRRAIFFFLIDKISKDSAQPIKELVGNCSDTIALSYLIFL